MNKDIKYLGIDISKDFFDVCDNNLAYYQFKNNLSGFRKLVKLLDSNTICVMEATGYYHTRLAYFLLELGFGVSVVNPLKIKRYIQMDLSKIKTDKSDAKMIQLYGKDRRPKLWIGQSDTQQESLQLLRMLSIYSKQSTQLKNKIHGEEVLGYPSKVVVNSLNRSLKKLKKEMEVLEKALNDNVKKEYQESLTLLKSIPGIGDKTALMLLVFTDGFHRFESSKELCSYAGLTPIIRQSGSSVKGRPRISKMGNPKLRNLLFMCSFNACKYNQGCKALYDRIVAKGKSKKLALIAVCNKLLKQAFSIVKNGVPYNNQYKSTLVNN
ncbi:Transposase [Tenacibaculum sp. MAR_2009_124]|uniref:IS110 family transposase n=1 Tax=Tenacibaculum sp. MAR_2009_124 TaxID=1250059 RepID=UPI000897CA25|nr:IS110 family transposase [Tenacibaculum sp. MAR_2009_124]SEB49808.1 Transposase [Tenacibaculum sp. MAR_2009_124]SEB86997.1 Transposase [Tenacibaculum sp. MAR_2009_124]